MIKIARTDSNNPDFHKLISLLDSDLNSRYGEIQKQYNPYNKIEFLNTVVIAYSENQAIGCGCFKDYDKDSIEIKRMIIEPEFRGTGIAKQIVLELEKWAIEKRFPRSILETGIK